jgi:hypothetical protein
MLKSAGERTNANIFSYLVSPTYLAEHDIKNAQVTNKNILIKHTDGPSTLLQLLQQYNTKNSLTFSKAQNNSLRMFVKPFEFLLNRTVDQRLTPNEVSLLGLEYMMKSQQPIIHDDASDAVKVTSVFFWIKAMLMDMVDGIRARSGSMYDENGQLVDVFCDRGKEFIQLYFRATKRIKENHADGIDTFNAAISCILPSLSRAEAETRGVVVKEYDQQGGSMLSRTLALFKSFVAYIFGMKDKSFTIDKIMCEKNMATFKNRKSQIPSTTIKETESVLQQKAVLRMQLLVTLLMEENEIIEEYLSKNAPAVLDEYKKFISPILIQYSDTKASPQITQLFADLHLSIRTVINNIS